MKTAVTENNRNRFELSDEGVRAKQGHTTAQVDYQLCEPPDVPLYRTYPQRDFTHLQEDGIVRGRRRYTQLFPSALAAYQDAKKRRINQGVLVSVDAHQAYHDGTLFYLNNGQWFVVEVDACHLTLTDLQTEE